MYVKALVNPSALQIVKDEEKQSCQANSNGCQPLRCSIPGCFVCQWSRRACHTWSLQQGVQASCEAVCLGEHIAAIDSARTAVTKSAQ